MSDSADFTCDELKRFGLTLLQPRKGYRFTIDPLLLCDFSRAGNEHTIVDLGTGTGVIALVMARMAAAAKITGFEQDAQTAALAQENVRRNGLEGRVTLLQEDVLNVRRHLAVSCMDLVVSNPPYRRQGRGRLNPDPSRLAGRHETTAGLADFLAAAKYLVKPGGRICMVYHADRLSDLIVEAANQKLAVVRLRMVYGLPEAEAKIFLVELSKGRKQVSTQIMPPLVVRKNQDNYTDEVIGIFSGK